LQVKTTKENTKKLICFNLQENGKKQEYFLEKREK